MLGSIFQSLFSLMDSYMLPYQEVFHVQLHRCWPNLTRTWIPPVKVPKILFSETFYIFENRTIHTWIHVFHLIYTVFFEVSMLLVFLDMLSWCHDSGDGHIVQSLLGSEIDVKSWWQAVNLLHHLSWFSCYLAEQLRHAYFGYCTTCCTSK